MNLDTLSFLELNKLTLDINIELLTRYWYIWSIMLFVGFWFILKDK